jgi:hypothetical protein
MAADLAGTGIDVNLLVFLGRGGAGWRACPGSSPVAGSPSVLIRAAIAGLRRSLFRQRLRHGPMLPTGMPSLALIWAYGTGGSSVSRVISRWQLGSAG